RNRSSLSDVNNIKAYLATAIRNQLFQLVRRTLKEKDRLEQWKQTEVPLQISYEDMLVALQGKEAQKEQLRRAMEQLTPRQKEYLHLKFYEGMSYEQIAEKTGQALKTIYNTTYEAIKILRRKISL
ncbi:MAG TPA: sigma-70 family RNA polymerase sigma factor, partial [Chitinophagaceae bacterium]|nr:sigma-70 family RNA polymerase sigma factor [Chitinophagaceae bacterium]